MSGARIGEILVGMSACTREAVQQALENQVIFGGRLGTNLLEIGDVTEESLARALGRKYGMPCLFGDLTVDRSVLALLTPEQVDRYEVIPYLVHDRSLALLVSNPNALRALDEIAFATGKRVHPIVVPEARMWALMRSLYGVERQLRGIEVDFGSLRRRNGPAAPPAAEAPPSPAPELMDESEFRAIYAAGRQVPAPAADPEIPEPIVDLTEEVVEPVPVPSREALERAVTEALRSEARAAPGLREPGRAADRPPAPAPPEPEPSPLGFADAVRFLEGVADRGAVARTVLRYARSRFRRAMLLTVQRGVAQGWEGFGEGLTPAVVRGVRVKLGAPSAIDTVVSTRAHFLGPLARTEWNIRFLRALGGGAPKNAFVVPILALGRVVNVLHADNGRGGLVDTDVGELLILATKIARSYEVLLARARR